MKMQLNQETYLNGVLKPFLNRSAGEDWRNPFMTVSRRSTRKTPISNVESSSKPVEKPAVEEPVNKKAKSKKPSSISIPTASVSIKEQNLIVRTILDRLDGKSVILNGIERTKS